MKEFCMYTLIDKQTKKHLLCGWKFKDFSSLKYNFSFRPLTTFFRKVKEYERTLVIKGRKCCILYWTEYRPPRCFSNIFKNGQLLNLKARTIRVNKLTNK